MSNSVKFELSEIESSCDEEYEHVEERIPRISEMSHSEAKRAFIRSIKNENHSNLKRILKHRDDIDVNMNSGWPLLYSIENDCYSIFNILISQPDINLNIQSGKPLLLTIEHGRYEMFRKLLKEDVDLNLCTGRLINVVKESEDSRYKFHLTKRGFMHFHAHTPSYLKR